MRSLLMPGLLAGLAAGLLCALLQFALVQPQILLAERYESGELVHSTGGTHQHAEGEAAPETAEAPAETHAHDAHGEEVPALQRNGLTVLFAILTYAGYGLVLSALMQLARGRGIAIDAPRALLWGMAGFLAFQMMPALGLPPAVPGTPAADITDRQIWWAMTAVATLAGLAVLFFASPVIKPAGAVLLAVPHVLGAPRLDDFFGSVPPELASSFATNTLGVGLATWLVLGYAVWHFSQDPAP